MKKNLILLFLCIGLATLAYFVEERGTIERRAQKEKETRIFDMQKYGELKSFETQNTFIEFKNNQAFLKASSKLVDSTKMNLAFEVLSKIRLVRILEDHEVTKENRKFFFPSEKDYMNFQFKLRKVRYLIGKKIATDRSFYLEIEKENKIHHVIAHDPSDIQHIVTKENSAQNDAHYRKLKSILRLGDDFFEDLHVFNQLTQAKLANTQEIYFKNRRNRSFRINLVDQTSLPVPPQSIQLDPKKSLDFIKSLKTLQAQKVEDTFHPSEYYGELAQIIFIDKQQKEWEIKLFSEFRKSKGYYLLAGDRLFKLDKKHINLFMANAQDFWNKKLNIPKDPIGKIQFPKRDSVDIKIKDDKKFSVETKKNSKRISHKEFQKIYNFLKTEADFISESSTDKFQGVSKSLFDLNLEKLELNVSRTKGEIIVHDKSNKLEYHYLTGENEPFSFNPDEVVIK